MNQQSLLIRLKQLRDELDRAIHALEEEPDPPPATEVSGATSPAAMTAAPRRVPEVPSAGRQQSSPGFLDALDLSDSLRSIYLAILRHDGLTLPQIEGLPELAGLEGVAIMVRTLARQGQLNREMDQGEIRYSAKTSSQAGRRELSDDIWNALESP